ncbi:hypothetical protein IAQ61_008803 [Plenodomus lingam]|uniref:uncharacterized protein n=1 Tax=Leptosphaeria maculans TaxID=5022 RepID=UPI00331D7848|nr:hypothetical protein IAQ61_008803 [Plenodomus lingam]
MKPQKRTIKDFFSGLPRAPPLPKTTTTEDADTTWTSDVTSTDPKFTQPHRHQSLANQSSSFASTSSTLSSAPTTTRAPSVEEQLPIPSQTSGNSGATRRVVSNGEHIVLNSDSDDNDSLQSLDFGDVQPKSTFVSKNVVDRSRASPEKSAEELHRPVKKGRTGKKTYTVVVETAQKNAEIERRIQEHKQELDRSSEEPTFENEAISEERLGQVVQDDDDPEKARRLYLAMQRTNTAQSESVYYFFKSRSESIVVQRRFPSGALPRMQWASSFRDGTSRDQAFLTGFAYQIFRMQELPEELALWMLDQFCYDHSEILLTKYLEILESHHAHLSRLLDCSRIDAMFNMIGASIKDQSTTAGLPLMSRLHGEEEPALPPSLKSIVTLIQRAAPWLRTKARSHVLHILFFVCLDKGVLSDSQVLDMTRSAIEAITCNFTDNKKLVSGLSNVIPQILSKITDPILQRNLVCALPAWSPLTAYLQRYLALSFLLFPQVVDVPLANPKIPQMIHKHLDTASSFRIDKRTNYAHLAARTTLLDVAIGPGPLSVPYQPLVSPAPSQAGSSPVMVPFPDTSDIKAFNQEVDALAQHIKMLGNSIVEAGAVVDLSILEAKDATERLWARLEHAVRLGGKKTHNVFGAEDDEERQLKLNRFFLKPKKTASTPTARGIFDDDDAGESLA